MGIAGVSFLTLLVFRVNFNEIVIVIFGTQSEIGLFAADEESLYHRLVHSVDSHTSGASR